MITVVHGDDLASSRKYFINEKEKAKDPILLKGDQLALGDLVQALEGSSVFSEEKDIFIFLTYN